MYQAKNDEVVPLADPPRPDLGAPLPVVLADEYRLFLGYIASTPDASWDGTSVRVVAPASENESTVLVTFARPYCHYLGAPNDEAFAGHPLEARGLEPYSVNEVRASSWIALLERQNSIHYAHRSEDFARLRHFIFAFHDSTFECVAEGFSFLVQRGSMLNLVELMCSRLSGHAA